jgi:phosphoheptose isomerase
LGPKLFATRRWLTQIGAPSNWKHQGCIPSFFSEIEEDGRSAMTTSRQDPRHLNDAFDRTSLDSYKRGYAQALAEALNAISSSELERVADKVVETANNGRTIIVAGNGGSAAIAEHLCCDWTKGTACTGHPVIDTRSLTSNSALYSAVANDFGFETVFEKQIDFIGKPGDLLIAISSSGNSANIINAAVRARSMGIFVASFTGFSGGKLRDLGDASIHVPIQNYGIVEDGHQAAMHVIAQYIAERRDAANQAQGQPSA